VSERDLGAALDRALELALRGRGEVEPNPCVGALVLAEGQAVGEGWHRAWGRDHAEVEALARAKQRAHGATLVVSLEPCSTRGKTQPCTDAVLRAGIARVVVGAIDPNPEHAGRGLELLRDAGVEVLLLPHAGCEQLAAGFARGLSSERPHVLLKWAMSPDGCVAASDGAPVHLTGARGDARVHHWRAHVDAILVGVQTVLNDDPLLTARGAEAPFRPLRRVVLDPTLRLPLHCQLADSAGDTPTWVIAGEDADQQPESALEGVGVRVLRVPGGERWLQGALAALRLSGVQRLLVEGGPRTHASFLEAGLWDQLALFLCPTSVGAEGLPALPGRSLAGMNAAAVAHELGLSCVREEPLGDDVLLRGLRCDEG